MRKYSDIKKVPQRLDDELCSEVRSAYKAPVITAVHTQEQTRLDLLYDYIVCI